MTEKEAQKKPGEQDIQQKMMQFQILEGNLRALRAQSQEATLRMEELLRSKAGLEELENIKAGDSTFMPMGAGNFVEGKITDPSRVLMLMAGDIAVKKTREDAIKLLDSRTEEMKKMMEDLAAQEQRIVAELQKLQPVLQRALQR